MQEQICQIHICSPNLTKFTGLGVYSLFSSFFFWPNTFTSEAQNIRIVLWVILFEEYPKNKYYILETSIIMLQNELKWKRGPL